MNPILIVTIAGLAGALAIAVLSATRHQRLVGTVTPLDPETAESWIVRHAPERWRSLVHTIDRRVAGGAALVVAFAVVLGAALAVGWVLDSVDEGRGFARFDSAAAEWGATHATETSTRLLEKVTELGGTLPLLAVAVGVAAVELHRRRSADIVLYLAAVLGGVTLVNNGLKMLVDRERPDVAQLVGWSGASFPSGHTAAAAASWAAFALVLSRRRRRPVRVVAAAAAVMIAAVVAASRVLLGVHWLTDVIAGLVLGWGWFLVVSIAFGGRLLRLGEPADRLEARPASSPGPPLARGGDDITSERHELETR
jgi:membrane-associated phospholipid phosphatase